MPQIERILCPIDFSDFSERAYAYAISLARHYGTELFAQHIVQPSCSAYAEGMIPDAVRSYLAEARERAGKRLAQFIKDRATDGPHPKVVVCEGHAADTILSFAQGSRADLVVMGTHGRRGFDRLALGSVTEVVLRKASCPVLVIRKPLHDFVEPGSLEAPIQLKRILTSIDFSPASERALDYATSLATEYGAELCVLHVLSEFPEERDLPTTIGAAVEKLEAMAPEGARQWCELKPAVRVGKPFQQIIEFALERQSDLIVMGASGHSALDQAIFGSTTHRVIQLGPAPVLSVPNR